MVSLVNAIRVNESGQEQYQQLLPPPNDSASKAMSTKSPGKKSSFINRSFRKLRMKFKPEPRSDSSSEAVTIAAQQVIIPVVFLGSIFDARRQRLLGSCCSEEPFSFVWRMNEWKSIARIEYFAA